jgi:hypothetical protein
MLDKVFKYVKRRKGNRENTPALKDCNVRLISNPIEKANTLNSYYASVFSCEQTFSQIQSAHSGELFTINLNVIRKRLAAIRRSKSIGPDGVPGDILKLGGEAMIPYLARLLEITINNATITSDWKKAIVFPIYKAGDRSEVTNYRPVSLTSVVCKQIEHAIAGYLRQVWKNSEWFYEGQHGFRPGYSCESQTVTVCQDIAFDLVPHDRLLTKIMASGMDSMVVAWVRQFLLGRTQRVRVGGQMSEEVRVTSGVPQVLAYVSDIWMNIESTIPLFADDSIIYRKIMNDRDTEKLQIDLDRVGGWAEENAMKINPGKCKAVRLTRARVKKPLKYCLGDHRVPEASSCKYLGIIIRSDLSWADQ